MYESFYGLSEPAFDLTPNPRFLLLTDRHREALSNLRYGISGRKGVTLLTGDAGTGKTTLVRAALEGLNGDARAVYINNPALTRPEFIETLARRLDLTPEARESKATLLSELTERLHAERAVGRTTTLVIDEAQSLPLELLEEIRLLANIETDNDKLLPLVLAGQPELGRHLQMPELRQLKQRIALRCALHPLTQQETAAYIEKRIRVAGGKSTTMFSREAVMMIHERSLGIPRTVNVLCDNALVSGFAAGERPVGRRIVLDVCRDFDIDAPGVPPLPVRSAVADGSPHEAPEARSEESGRQMFANMFPTARRARPWSR
jgi:general secretion pathway protein A